LTIYDMNAAALAEYRSSVVRPGDFDEFWAGTLEEARRFPSQARFEPFDAGLSLVDVFDVTFPGFGGHPVRGWFILPPNPSGPLPLVVRYIGYGGGRGFAHDHLVWPAAGYAHFVMDTRGQGSGWTPGATPDPEGSDPAHPGFMTRGILDRNTYYYRRVMTDAVRAIDAAMRHPGADESRIAVCGGSQGGGLALAAAALHPEVKAVMADVPFLSDFPRAVRLAPNGPYPEISRYLAIHRDKVDTAFETLRYFDCACFAPRITAPALVSVATMDLVCPPSTVHAVYNALASGDRTLTDYAFNDHEGGGPFQQQAQVRWLAERFLA
jgi:cephalosporin-C deacetylase